MSRSSHGEPRRYFINNLPDHVASSEVIIDEARIKDQILQIVSNILKKEPPSAKHADGGLYVGIGGIAYMFFHLSQNRAFQHEKEQFVAKGLEYIREAERFYSNKSSRDAGNIVGFLLGASGCHAVSAVLNHCIGHEEVSKNNVEQYSSAMNMCLPINFLPYGGDELLVGRAGVINGDIWLENVLGRKNIPTDLLVKVCKSTFDSGQIYARAHCPHFALMYSYYQTEYLGAAHGLSSIVQMLLSVPEFLSAYPEAVPYLKKSVDDLLSVQTENGNFPPAMDEVGSNSRSSDNELVHWCHGGPGVIYLLAKAYLIWKEERYLIACLKIGDLVWEKGLLKKGPGICHGIAGSGYVFLLLYQLTNDKKHLHRAKQFAEFLNSSDFERARIPDSPYSLYEGWAGTVCFLADLLAPEKAEFPFFKIFS
ncbi:hypothetical protein LSTR_LSTR003274 [Laodelphax striatellus]|uniref:LanC-like protein 3 homolog n=1 Tax=Laodelphax striatellus TaxID=195883 RepID=A0A482XTA3_LAOST|nr:hypothetical protein LSTR_LSTR003274 [Laodelphax striatellus]